MCNVKRLPVSVLVLFFLCINIFHLIRGMHLLLKITSTLCCTWETFQHEKVKQHFIFLNIWPVLLFVLVHNRSVLVNNRSVIIVCMYGTSHNYPKMFTTALTSLCPSMNFYSEANTLNWIWKKRILITMVLDHFQSISTVVDIFILVLCLPAADNIWASFSMRHSMSYKTTIHKLLKSGFFQK